MSVLRKIFKEDLGENLPEVARYIQPAEVSEDGRIDLAQFAYDERRVLHYAVTFLGNALEEEELNQCAELASRLANLPYRLAYNTEFLTMPELMLGYEVACRYAEMIPSLIAHNPRYAEHRAEFLGDLDRLTVLYYKLRPIMPYSKERIG